MLSLKVLSKKQEFEKDGKKKSFRTYFTPVHIIVKGEEDKGLQSKTLKVKFTQDVRIPEANNFMLVVDIDKKQISIPEKYEVTEKDGKKEYPTVWIRGYDSYTPLHRKTNSNTAFGVVFDSDDEVSEAEIDNAELDKDDLPF